MDRELLDTAAAAARLGVKRETLYAYVSRGLLRRYPADDGRASRFDAAEVDQLTRQRGSRRTGGRPAGLPAIAVASGVTTIIDDQLRYRGHDVAQLVGAQAFEAVAELLWTGELPDRAPSWHAPGQLRRVVQPIVAQLPPAASPADRLRVVVATAAAADPLRVDLRPEAVVATARGLMAVLVDALGPATGPDGDPGPLAHRVAAALGADQQWFAAIEAALVLLADHELASSTLAARIAASTRADPYQVVLAGLAVLSGPLHGSASAQVHRLLADAAEPPGAEVALASWLRQADRVPGFGHALYRRGDPRAQLLLPLVRAAAQESGRRRGAMEEVLGAMARRSPVLPNIDFALGALSYLSGLAPGSGEAIFALARAAGWLAHALEEYGEPPLRFRVRAEPMEVEHERTDSAGP